MSKKYIRALIKITSKESFAKDFRNGKIYMNNLDYFIKCEKEEIGDEYETTAAVMRYMNPYNGGNLNIFFSEETDKYIPAFCMFALIGEKYSYRKRIIISNEKLKRFGEFAVIVTDVESYLNRLRQNSLYRSSLVKYIDYFNLSDEDKRAIFNPIVKKSIHFKHQSEFRIYSNKIRISKEKDLHDIFGENFRNKDFDWLNLGNLSEMTTEVIPIGELFRGLNGIELRGSNELTCIDTNDLTTMRKMKENLGEL